MDNPTGRMVDALDLIAAELERLRLLKEYELKAQVVANPDPWVKPDATEE